MEDIHGKVGNGAVVSDGSVRWAASGFDYGLESD